MSYISNKMGFKNELSRVESLHCAPQSTAQQSPNFTHLGQNIL